MMRNKYFFAFALCVYGFLYMATSKKDVLPPDSCKSALQTWFIGDTARTYSATLLYGIVPNSDSLICIVYDTTRNLNWTIVADSLCSISKNKCNKLNVPVLIANRQNPNIATWETRYGKTIISRVCP